MKWLIYYSTFYCTGKGEPASEEKVVGYSNLNEQELFITLKEKYPNVPIRKKTKSKKYTFLNEYIDENGKEDLPYSDYVFFKENDLKEF